MANIKYSSSSCSRTSAPRPLVHVRIVVILEMTVPNCLVACLVPSAIPFYKLIMIDAVGVQNY
jgi:hypothetical protein